MLRIDGSHGSGSGTIIRLAMSLSMMTKKPFKINNIRAKRCNPGLQEQHLQVVNSISELCNGKAIGNKLHSKEIEFHPGDEIRPDIKIKINTAGSIGLVLQAIMLPSFFSEHKKTEIEISGGGTLGKFAPNLLYTKEVFLPIIRKIGFDAEIEILKHGFYPRGGADIIARVHKNKIIKSLDIEERGKLSSIRVISLASSDLRKKEVCERMSSYAKKILKERYNVEIKTTDIYADTLSTGAGLLLIADFENTLIASDSLGERGKTCEKVAEEAVNSLTKQLSSNCTLDEYMSDQILSYLALCRDKCFFRICEPTEHIETNIWLLEKFLDVKFSIENRVVKKN